VKTVKRNKWKIFEGLLSEGNKESCKAKIWNHRSGDTENVFVAALNMMLFLQDLLDSEKSESIFA
jgi:hypothetical protein